MYFNYTAFRTHKLFSIHIKYDKYSLKLIRRNKQNNFTILSVLHNNIEPNIIIIIILNYYLLIIYLYIFKTILTISKYNIIVYLYPSTQILTQEDWNIVLFNGMEKTSHWAALYFVTLMTFGNYVLFNLLVAILVEGFSSEV